MKYITKYIIQYPSNIICIIQYITSVIICVGQIHCGTLHSQIKESFDISRGLHVKLPLLKKLVEWLQINHQMLLLARLWHTEHL